LMTRQVLMRLKSLCKIMDWLKHQLNEHNPYNFCSLSNSLSYNIGMILVII
jgi:hypothetical protein